MRFLFASILILFSSTLALRAQESWVIDHDATEIVINVGYINEPKLRVAFERFTDATFFDPARPEITQSVIHVESASARSGIGIVNGLLRGPDYLDSDEFPFIRFFLRELRQTSPSTADAIGDLTLLGVTRPIVLKAEVFAYAPNAPDPEKRIAGFNIRGNVDRLQFGSMIGAGRIDNVLPIEIRLVFRPPA